MSEYIKGQTVFKAESIDCLAKALEDIMPHWSGKIEVNASGLQMFDYHQKAVRAEIVIRQPVAGGWGDMGFATTPDGGVELISDEGHRERRRGNDMRRGEHLFPKIDEAWLSQLSKHYAYRVAEKQAAKIGATITKSINPDGTWRVVLRKPVVKAWQQAGRSW